MKDIRIEELTPQRSAAVEYVSDMAGMADNMGAAFGEVMQLLGSQGVQPLGMPFALYPDMEPSETGGWKIVAGFPISGAIKEEGRVKNYELPGGTVAIMTYLGPYEGLEGAYKSMSEQLLANGYELSSPMWEAYFTDPDEEPDHSKWRTDIYWPVLKRKG